MAAVVWGGEGVSRAPPPFNPGGSQGTSGALIVAADSGAAPAMPVAQCNTDKLRTKCLEGKKT